MTDCYRDKMSLLSPNGSSEALMKWLETFMCPIPKPNGFLSVLNKPLPEINMLEMG